MNLETRRGKEEYTREELLSRLRDIDRSVGIDQDHVEWLRRFPWPLGEGQIFRAKEELFREALANMADDFSHFAEKDLVRRVDEEAQGGGIHGEHVREMIARKIGTGEILRLVDVAEPKIPGEIPSASGARPATRPPKS